MNLKTFQDFFERKGFKISGNTALGKEYGYPAAVTYISGNQWRLTLTVRIDDFRDFKQQFRLDTGKKYKLFYRDEELTVAVNIGGKLEYDAIYPQMVDQIAGYLSRKGYKVPDICPVCSRPDCDTLARYAEGYHPIHRGCLNASVESAKAAAERSITSGNYVTGILGALLGMIVGIIPSLLTIIFTQTIYSILFALIPLCIYQGYKMLKGKMTRAVSVISIILSVISVYVMEIVLIGYYMAEDYGASVADGIATVLMSLGSPSLWVSMTQDSIMSFVFIALGISIMWKKITHTGHTEIRTTEEILQTAVPLLRDDAFTAQDTQEPGQTDDPFRIETPVSGSAQL